VAEVFEIFQPTWLYHPSRPRGVLVESQEVYDSLMAQGGWVDSPAIFGVITAPNTDQQVLQDALVLPPVPVAPPSTGPAVQALDDRVAVLESRLEALAQETAQELAILQERLDALTARLPAPAEAAPDPESAPRTGGRR
jgi:hypothetical protein